MRGGAALGAGIVVVLAAISPPVHAAADALFSVHMVQHLALMIGAAPLIAVGLRWRPASGAIPIWIGATSVLWAWHLPAVYDAALASDPLHVLEHASFLVTSVVFWTFVLSAAPALARIGLTFATALQSSALGALLAFASRPLYASHLGPGDPTGITPLEDQQLAGAIMWVPPGVLYLIVMLVLLYRWFNALDASSDVHAAPGKLS